MVDKDVFIAAEDVERNMENFTLIDVRPYQKYVAGHIPRSIWIWFWDFTRHKEGKPSSFKSESELAKILGKYGISEKDHVVIVYDSGTIGVATYTLWLLEYMGQEKVQLLKGGIDEWIKENRPIEKGIYTPKPKEYNPRVRRGIRASLDEIVEIVNSSNRESKPLLLDVRTPQEYTGALKNTPRPGRIPGSVLTPPEIYIDALFGRIRDDMSRLLNEIRKRGAITYCTTGERASFAWFVLTKILKLDNIKLFPESFYEYSSRQDLPIEKD